MKRVLLLIGLLTACKEKAPPPPPQPVAAQPASQPASQPGDTKPDKPAASTVEYQDSRCSGAAPCACTGTIQYGQNAIKKLGITEADLAAGTPCILGDLDGNGTRDIAFVGKDYGGGAAVGVQVLLFDSVGLRDTPAFPKKVQSLSLHTVDGKTGLLEAPTRTFFVYENGKFEMKKI